MSSLPENAFLHPDLVDWPERFDWMARRNSLFASATAEERKVLLDLSDWYTRQRLELIRKPNIFSRSSTAMAFRHFAWMKTAMGGTPSRSPGWEVRALATVSKLIDWGDERLAAWQCRRFQERLIQQVSVQQEGDLMLGVAYFFCALRLELAPAGTEALSKGLSALAETSLYHSTTPVTRLLDRVVKLILLEQSTSHQHQLGRRFPTLEEHAWRLLLRATQDDPKWALSFIDEHWRKPSRWSGVFSVFSLQGQSELAYDLAMVTRPDRPEFAADMLLESLRDAGWQVTKNRDATSESQVNFVDAACDRLWSWIKESLPSGSANEDLRDRLDALFRYGNPQRPYWAELPTCARAVIESMSLDDQARVLPFGLLTRVIFYSKQDSPDAIRGMALFQSCLEQRSRIAPSARQLMEAAVHATEAIAVLEGGILAGRNRFVAAQPEHPLMQVVADYLDETREKMREFQPSAVLVNQMSLTLGVKVETLFRRLIDQFQTEFTLRVAASPTDAGLALQSLIQYKGYGQSDGDMYRKQVCQDLFDALLPSLDAVSAEDAAVARSGIGWSPRPRDL